MLAIKKKWNVLFLGVSEEFYCFADRKNYIDFLKCILWKKRNTRFGMIYDYKLSNYICKYFHELQKT